MKKIRFEWVNTDYGTDNYLSIISDETLREVAQLRKSPKFRDPGPCGPGIYYRHRDRTWGLHPSGLTDAAIDELFGENWYYETYGGFETVEKFKDYARRKGCL